MSDVVLAGRSIAALAGDLAAGRTTARALTEAVLGSIAGDGGAFVKVHAARARAEADASDALRAQGVVPSVFAGIPVSVKDLFDIRGETTMAGSVVLADAAPAQADAPVVARLRAAGAVIVGRTHMSEFAFTGLGANPHFPPCTNPHDPARVPGGSSSGAAVSVARGQAAMGLGTDTGGSVRIPAAFSGLTGFKPTQSRVTRAGAFPLSETLDSIGPIANSVACCAAADAILADVPTVAHAPLALRGLRIGVPADIVLDDMSAEVAQAFDAALARLADAGAVLARVAAPELRSVVGLFARGAIAGAEAFELHSRLGLLARADQYDPMVRVRIEAGGRMGASDLVALHRARRMLVADAVRAWSGFDVLAMPTTPRVAPRFDEIADAASFAAANGLALRNTLLFNFLDRCAISLPMQASGRLPCGLMLVGEPMGDMRLLAVAAAVEGVLAGRG